MGTIPFEPIPLPVALSLKACYTSVASGYWHRYEAPLRQLSSRFITRDSRYQPSYLVVYYSWMNRKARAERCEGKGYLCRVRPQFV